MTFQCLRNGQVLILDTTFGTNQFNYKLAAIGCLSGNGKSHPVAVALIKQQESNDFEWMLECMRAKLDSHDSRAWSRIRTWITDGDAAMELALAANSPDSFHMRCVFHITMNVRIELNQSNQNLK